MSSTRKMREWDPYYRGPSLCCSRCEIWRPVSDFAQCSSSKLGYYSRCRKCSAEQHKKNMALPNRREALNAQQRASYAANRERICAYRHKRKAERPRPKLSRVKRIAERTKRVSRERAKPGLLSKSCCIFRVRYAAHISTEEVCKAYRRTDRFISIYNKWVSSNYHYLEAPAFVLVKCFHEWTVQLVRSGNYFLPGGRGHKNTKVINWSKKLYELEGKPKIKVLLSGGSRAKLRPEPISDVFLQVQSMLESV